jgi:hypothetical protein
MRSARATWLCVLVGCGATAHTAQTQPGSFPIQLHRPMKLGARWHVVSDGTSSEASSTFTEQVVVKKSDKHAKVHFDATASAVAVEDGVVSRADYAIVAFEKNGATLVPAGHHVVVETAAKKEDARIEVDGQPAAPEVRDALDVVLSLARDNENEDAIFGTALRQPIGGSWPVAIGPTKLVLERNGAVARDEAISGHVTLSGTERVEADDCLDVRVDLHINAFTPTPGRLPEGSQVTKGTVAMTALFVLPVDVTRRVRRGELDVRTEFEAFVPVQSAEDAGVTVETQTHQHRVESLTPL